MVRQCATFMKVPRCAHLNLPLLSRSQTSHQVLFFTTSHCVRVQGSLLVQPKGLLVRPPLAPKLALTSFPTMAPRHTTTTPCVSGQNAVPTNTDAVCTLLLSSPCAPHCSRLDLFDTCVAGFFCYARKRDAGRCAPKRHFYQWCPRPSPETNKHTHTHAHMHTHTLQIFPTPHFHRPIYISGQCRDLPPF